MNKTAKRSSSYVIWAALIAGAVWFIYSLFQPTETANLQAQSIEDLGREHVRVGTPVDYNSNPPTSGPHYAEWTRSGIYNEPIEDGYLIHALEHGYVIVSYNCDISTTSRNIVQTALAHETDEPHEEEATAPAQTPSPQDTPGCQELVDQLTDLADELKLWKLIVIPRPTLDTRIALTAWTKIDKFNAFDRERIVSFVNAYRNQGPEKTVE